MPKFNKTFLGNVAIVSFGPIFASVLGFFAEPWIARFWDPALFGIGAYFNSIILMISPLFYLRYNFAIIQAKDREEAGSLFVLSLIIMSVLITILYFFYGIIVKFASNEFPFENYKLIFFVTIIAASLSVLFRFWYSSQKKFVAITISTVIVSLLGTILLLIFGSQGKTTEANMVFIRAVPHIAVVLVLLIPILKKDLLQIFKSVSVSSIVSAAKKHKRYPLFEYWGYLAYIINFSIPILLIAKYWGQETNGLFAKSFNLLYIFVALLGESVNRVLHKEVADKVNNKEEIASLIGGVRAGLYKLAILPTVIIVLLGPEIFTIFLGSKWELSGRFAQWVMIWMFAAILNNSILPVFGVLNKQKQFTFFTVFTLIVRIIILTTLGLYKVNILVAVAIFSIVNFVVTSATSSYVLHLSKVNIRDSIKQTAKPTLQLVPYIVIVAIMKYVFKLSPINLLILAAALSIPYIYLFYIRNSDILSMVLSFGKNKLGYKYSSQTK
jgi:O-antigen/teichoic acid export membrane protein